MTWQDVTGKAKPGGHRAQKPALHRVVQGHQPRLGDPMKLTYKDLVGYVDFNPDAPATEAPAPGMPKPTKAGLRKMTGPAMRLEKIDPKHRMGEALVALFDWCEAYPMLHATPFFPWVDGLRDDELKVAWLWHNSKLTPDDLRDRLEAFKFGVAYMTPQEAESYRATTDRGGMIQWRGQPLNTLGSQTAHGGQGAYIWVLDRANAVYTAPHSLGRLHHSSFKAGHAVKAAGEWVVENGQLVSIAALSGHYKTPAESFIAALRILRDQVSVNIFTASVSLWKPKVPAVAATATTREIPEKPAELVPVRFIAFLRDHHRLLQTHQLHP
jgi:hypothetical protein